MHRHLSHHRIRDPFFESQPIHIISHLTIFVSKAAIKPTNVQLRITKKALCCLKHETVDSVLLALSLLGCHWSGSRRTVGGSFFHHHHQKIQPSVTKKWQAPSVPSSKRSRVPQSRMHPKSTFNLQLLPSSVGAVQVDYLTCLAYDWCVNLGAPAALVAVAVVATLYENVRFGALDVYQSGSFYCVLAKKFYNILLLSAFGFQIMSIFVTTVTCTMLSSQDFTPVLKQMSSRTMSVLGLMRDCLEFEYLTARISFLHGLLNWLAGVAMEWHGRTLHCLQSVNVIGAAVGLLQQSLDVLFQLLANVVSLEERVSRTVLSVAAVGFSLRSNVRSVDSPMHKSPIVRKGWKSSGWRL